MRKSKLKKPNVPKTPGLPPAFWVYVVGSQVEIWNWSLPLEPAGATLSNAVGNSVSVRVNAGVVERGWGRGSDCDPRNWAGTVTGEVRFDFSSEGIRLESWIGSDEDLGWEFANDSDADFVRKFSKKDRAALLNPRKGTLTFTLSHNAAGSAQPDTGICSAWGSDGSCTWAHTWGLKVMLVRADPMDLVTGP